MKKIIIALLMAVIGLQGASAQVNSKEFYKPGKRIGLNVGFGIMDGITIEASTSLTQWCSARVGIDFVPGISFSFDGHERTNIDNLTPDAKAVVDQALADQGLSSQGLQSVDWKLKASAKRTQGHVLFDAYPFPKASSFFITGGFYFGGGSVATGDLEINREIAVARDALLKNDYADQIRDLGINVGDIESLPIDQQGKMKAYAKVNSFRPYVGFGFGRVIPKHRVGCRFEMGVQFHGTPQVVYYDNDGNKKNLLESEILKDDKKDIEDIMNKVKVMPVLKFSICGRIL